MSGAVRAAGSGATPAARSALEAAFGRADPERHLVGNYRRLPTAFVRGTGCLLEEAGGRRVLDFVGGIAVSSLGHGHPALVEALRDQVGRYLHVSNLYHVPEQVEAAELLAEASGLERAFFCNSGAEAVEAGIKLARKWGAGREPAAREIVVAEGSFHGRTLGALAATWPRRYREPFEPLPGGFRFVPFNDLEAAEEAVGPSTCAVLVEPIQGEGGVVPADPGYLEGLRSLTERHGALLVLDEVQTGVGRTGETFAFRGYGVRPDAVALAKGLGGGVPVGALVAREEVAAHLVPGDHASTFGGNPLASRAAATVLRTLEAESLCRNARERGRELRNGLERLGRETGVVTEVRGRGLLVAADLDRDAGEVTRRCLDLGLLVNAVGPRTLRLTPPLVVTAGEVDRALELIGRALTGEGACSEPGGVGASRSSPEG